MNNMRASIHSAHRRIAAHVSLAVMALVTLLPVSLLLAGPQPASAQLTEVAIWSATLTAGDLMGEKGDGCDSTASQEELHCVPGQLLTSNSFKYMGTEDRIVGVRVLYGNLRLTFYSPIDEFYLETLTLHVDGQAYALSDATVRRHALAGVNRGAVWFNTGLNWAPGDTVDLRLTTSICDVTKEVSGEDITITWNPIRTRAGSLWLYRNLVQGEYGFARADLDAGTITASAPFVWTAGGTAPYHDSSAAGTSREDVIKYVKEKNPEDSEERWWVRGPDTSDTAGLSRNGALRLLGAGGEERVNVQVRLWGSETCSNGGFTIPVTRQTQPIPGATGGL